MPKKKPAVPFIGRNDNKYSAELSVHRNKFMNAGDNLKRLEYIKNYLNRSLAAYYVINNDPNGNMYDKTYTDKVDEYANDPESNEIITHFNNDLDTLFRLAEFPEEALVLISRCKNKELGLKAAGMVWKQQQEHRAVIECPAGENADAAQKNLDVITAEKRVRGMARQSVTPEQDYVRRSNEAKDQLALIGHEYESGKLSWWRGSQQYKDIGTKLVEITNAWKDYLHSEQTIQQSFEKTGEVNIIAQNTLKMNTDALLTKLDQLKKNNSAYFDHKIKDGEFVKGTNDNIDKRIAIVQKIDRLADFLIETMNRKKKIIDDTVKAEKDRQQDKTDNAEIIININAPADIKLPEENPPEIKNEVERLSNIIVKDPEDQIVNDGSAKENAEQVKPDNIIEGSKNEAPADNKTPYEKAIALLDKKRSDAQGRLNNLRNSGKQITKDAIKNDMAEIITSLFIEAHLKKPGKEDNKKSNIAPKLVDEKLYNMFLNNTLKGAAFNHVLNHSGLMALCIQATVGKGQNIWNTYEKRKEFLSKQPKNDNCSLTVIFYSSK